MMLLLGRGVVVIVALTLTLSLLAESVFGAGNEEDVLIKNAGSTPATGGDASEKLWYSCTFRNLWTAERQPVNFPNEAKWTGPIAWTHTLQYQPWKASYPVTLGVEKLAEEGSTDALIQEFEQASTQVLHWPEYPAGSFSVNQRYFVHLPPLEASYEYPYMTFMAGMSPSPDWFTGFYSFWLMDEYTRTWYDHVKIQTKPWDAGTDAGTTYDAPDNDLDPQIPVERYVLRNAPEGGELRGPNGQNIPSVGELECLLTVGEEPLVLPEECDWIANPCCNETSDAATNNCRVLPNGEVPQTSPELQEVLQNRKVVTLALRFEVGFFEGTEIRDLEQAEIDGLLEQSKLFYESVLLGGQYADQFVSVNAQYIDSALNNRDTGLGIGFDFDLVVDFESGETAPGKIDVFDHLQNSDYQSFITEHLWMIQGIFFETQIVALIARVDETASSPRCPEPVVECPVPTRRETVICGDSNSPCEYGSECLAAAAGIYGCIPVEPTPTQRPQGINGGNSVLGVIQSDPELSEFAVALELSGLDSLLNENDKEFTVFAPSNQAIANDPVFSTYATMDGWIHHLRTNVQLMIVQNQVLTDADIFDAATTELVSLNGTLQISQPFAQVNLVSMERPNQAGSNGVVHTMDGVIKNYWREYTLRDVNQHDELVDGLSPILDRIQFDEPLMEFEPSGTSWIAARNRGYGNDSIALGFYPIVQELKDPNNAEFQNLTYMYNLIDFNLYEQDIERGFQLLVMPRAGVAHMWITKDMTKGLLRFNDAVLDRQAFASNGVTQIVTKPLIPPGLAMLMQFCADYTTINLKDMAQYYRSSEWNLRNLSKSIGTQQGSFSVFAPLQDGYGVFNIEVGVRISTLEWKRHLWDFLLHLTMEPAYTTDELYQLLEDAGGTMEVKMLSGFHTTFALDDEGELTIDGAGLLKPYDMKGVDGYIHLVEQVPLPPSVLYTIYDQTQQNPDMTTVTRLIDTVQLGVFIDNLLPMTFFSAVNSAWDIIIPSLEIEDVLKNMMFELLWFDDYLADMDGQQITSVNGKKWNVQVFDDPDGEPLHYDPERSPVRIYISNADGPEGLTNCTFMYGPNRTNILARTGVIHHMDCLLLDYNYSKVDQEAPTFAPVQVTSSPSINAGKCVDDSCPCGEFFAEEWGTCVELTCWNWHIHKNDDTFALSDTNPCQDEFHFCGGDGSCHPFSCENWYRYGAGFSMDNSPDDLICGDYVTLIDDLHSVSFGCRPYLPGRTIPQRRNEVFFFNEECIAAADGQEFRCYQNKVGTNYDDFLREAARLQQDSCDREMYDVDLPQYWYTAVVAQGRDSGGSTTHQRTLSGPTFDGEKADMTMYAITVTVPSSTTPPPADPVGRCLRQFNAAERCVIESQCEDACNNILALTNANIGNAAQSNDGEPPSLGDLVDVFVDIFDNVCNQTKTSVCQMRECCAGSCVPQIDDSFDCMIDAARKDFEMQLADLIADVSQPSIECSVTDHVCPSEDEVPASSEDEVPASNGTSANETSPQQTPATPANATIVQVNTTFDVFNTRGLKAEDLLLPENRAILIQALTDFITNLVEQIEGQNQQTRLLRLRSRYLAAVLLPGSSRIVDIRDVECRADGTIPENATCQNVYGQYDLKVDDNDDKESVYNTYLQATDDAIEQGKLQESLAAASPSSPITVGGPIERESASAGGSETSIPVNMIQATQEEGEEDDGEKGAAWWVVLLSCLAGIFGCCVLGVAGLYVKKQRDQDADNAENDGVLEAPVKLAQEGEMAPLEGAPEEETNEDAPGSDSNDDESREESHSIQDNEVGEDEASSPLVAREAPHDAQPLLSDDPSAFIGADGNDQTSPLMAQPAPIRDQQSDSDDDDEEWE